MTIPPLKFCYFLSKMAKFRIFRDIFFFSKSKKQIYFFLKNRSLKCPKNSLFFQSGSVDDVVDPVGKTEKTGSEKSKRRGMKLSVQIVS